MFCIKCGNEIKGEMKFCPKCGAELPKISNVILEETKNGDVQENTFQKTNNTVPVNNISEDKTEPSWKRFVNIKTFLIIPILVVIIAMVGLFSGSDDSKVEKNKSINEKNIEGEEETIINGDELTGVNNVDVPVKKEDGTLVNNFEQVSDKIYVADCYEKIDLQCPYEAILNQKDFNLYDKIYLIEHIVEEERVTEDADGNKIQQVEGITHYVLDTMRIMCEYTTNDKRFTVRKYYDVCMTYWSRENPDDWYAISSDYIFEDEELNYSNLNDTYWCVEGGGIGFLANDELIDWENGPYEIEDSKLKTYLHFHDLDKIQVIGNEKNGSFIADSFDQYIMCSAKVVYEGKCVEKSLVAGNVEREFVSAYVFDDSGLKIEINMHSTPNQYGQTESVNLTYSEKDSNSVYYKMKEITKEEFDNLNGSENNVNIASSSYTDDELCEMAQLYMKNIEGYDNPIAGVESIEGDIVSLCLYEYLDSRPVGSGYYYIDRNTGKGYDNLENQIDLTVVNQETDSREVPFSEYIIEGSDSGYFDESYLYGFSADECRLARNEIYARHGKIFKDATLQDYFNNCSWYTPLYDEVPESMLNQWEIENVKTIVGYEEKMGYR